VGSVTFGKGRSWSLKMAQKRILGSGAFGYAAAQTAGRLCSQLSFVYRSFGLMTLNAKPATAPPMKSATT